MDSAAATNRTGGYAWYVVAVLTLANVSAYMDRQILSLLVVPIQRDLHITDTQMSYLGGLAFALFYTALGLPIARLADRWNRRNIMAVGIGLWSLFTTLCATATGYGRLLLYRVGVGAGEGSLNAPSLSLLADYFPRERLSRAMSVYSLGVFLGSGIAYYVGGAIVGVISAAHSVTLPVVGTIREWQTVFLAVGLPGFIVTLLFFTIREPTRGVARGEVVARAPQSYGALARYVLANRRTFLTHSLGFALSALVNYAIAFWLATFFFRTYGWSAARAGEVMGLLTATVGVAGTLAGGWVADLYVRRGKIDGPLRTGIIGAVGMLISATALPLMPGANAAVAWLVVVNFFAAFPWGAASAAAAEIVPAPLRAQGAALYFLVLSIVSTTLGPSAVAWITDYGFHDPMALRYSLAIVNAAGMIGAIVLLTLGLPAYRRTLRYRETWIPEPGSAID
jgi:MFS family permease